MSKVVFLFCAFILYASTSLFAQKYTVLVQYVGAKYWHYIDLEGQALFESKCPMKYPFSECGIAVQYYPKRNLFTLINTDGEIIHTEIEKYQLKNTFGYGAKGFYDNVIAIESRGKWGCLNTNGQLVVPLKYDYISIFDKGFAMAKSEKVWHIIDTLGTEIPITNYEVYSIKPFSEGLALIKVKSGLIGFVDTAGQVVIPPKFEAANPFYNGLASARSSTGLWGYINTNGEWVIKPQYNTAKQFDKASGLARVKYLGKWGYANMNGDFIEINISDFYKDFSEGLARGRTNGKYGFYNNQGEWFIQPQFEGLGDFKNGFAAAKLNKFWGIIDRNGTWVIEPSFLGVKDVVIINEN